METDSWMRRFQLLALEWVIKTRSWWLDSSKPREAFHWSFQLLFLTLWVYWSLWLPPSGKAVLALTFVTVVMALAKMRPVHKFVWLLLAFAFVMVENSAMDKERQDFADNQASIRAGEQANFERIAQQNQHEFSETINRLQSIIDSNKDINNMTRKNLDNITGGDTYCYFTADTSQGRENPLTFPLTVWVIGEYPMRQAVGEIQTVYDDPNKQFASILKIVLPDALLSGVHPIDGIRVPLGRHIITVWSRRGLQTEQLELAIVNGRVKQTCDVFRDGKKLYECPNF
jgi:hypothetical protein